MSSHSNPDAGIPVLTEVIPSPLEAVVPEAAVPEAAPPAAPVAAAPLAQQHVVVHDAPDSDVRSDAQWERLEREIREAVLLQVLERIDVAMEQRVRDSLAEAMQAAVDNLAADIRVGLHYAIRDVVTRAVTQEIAKLQGGKQQMTQP